MMPILPPELARRPSGLARKAVQKLGKLPTPSAAGKRQLDQQPPDGHLLRFESRPASAGHNNSVRGSGGSICCRSGYGRGGRISLRGRSSRRRRHRRGTRSASRAAIGPGVQNELRWSVLGALLYESDVLVLDLLPQLLAAAAPSIQEDRLRHTYEGRREKRLIVRCSAVIGGGG